MEFTKQKTKEVFDNPATPAPIPLSPSDHDDEPFDEKRLWFGNIPVDISEFVILKLAQSCGELEKFDYAYHKTGDHQGKPRGFCFISYKDTKSADRALNHLNGYKIKDRRILVKHANQHKQSKDSIEQKAKPVTVNRSKQIAVLEAKLKQLEKQDTGDVKTKLKTSVKATTKPIETHSNSKTKPYSRI